MLWIELHILSDIYGASKRRCQCPKVNIQSFIFKLVFSKLHISYKKSIIFVSCINFLTIYMCPYSICHPIAFITYFCTKKFVAQTKNFFLHSPKKFSTHIPFLSSSVFLQHFTFGNSVFHHFIYTLLSLISPSIFLTQSLFLSRLGRSLSQPCTLFCFFIDTHFFYFLSCLLFTFITHTHTHQTYTTFFLKAKASTHSLYKSLASCNYQNNLLSISLYISFS